MMSEWHDYNEKNVSFCKTCKHLHDEFGNEEREYSDYHEIVPLGKSKKNKKNRYPATLNDFRSNAKLVLNPNYRGNSQLGAFEVEMEVDNKGDNKGELENTNLSKSKGGKRKTRKMKKQTTKRKKNKSNKKRKSHRKHK
jgi:hypothetical protein